MYSVHFVHVHVQVLCKEGKHDVCRSTDLSSLNYHLFVQEYRNFSASLGNM